MKNLSEKELDNIKKSTPIKVGEAIKKLRLKEGITQTDLAERVGKDRQYLYKIESGKVTPNISTIAVLCKALNIELVELFKEIKIV